MDRQAKMSKLWNRLIFETGANVSLAFASMITFQLFFYRKRFLLVQGLALGFTVGYSINCA